MDTMITSSRLLLRFYDHLANILLYLTVLYYTVLTHLEVRQFNLGLFLWMEFCSFALSLLTRYVTSWSNHALVTRDSRPFVWGKDTPLIPRKIQRGTLRAVGASIESQRKINFRDPKGPKAGSRIIGYKVVGLE